MTSRTYADNVVDYAQAGWPCVLPVPPEAKFPPPVGFTGAEGRDTDPLQLVTWAGDAKYGGWSIALRMPEGVIGIDVDQYDKGGVQKRGAETLAAKEAEWGALPPTWGSTARGSEAGPGPSRILFFRVPAGRYATKLTAGQTGDVEIIQRHHRYAVVAPSVNTSAGGAPYRWYTPDGSPSDRPPAPGELAELPQAWVTGLAEGATSAAAPSADRASGEQLLDQLTGDWRPECADITSARLTAGEKVRAADAGSRHDVMTERTHHLVQLAAGGHTGVAYAIEELRTVWAETTAGEDRGEEFERMLLTSARKAVSVVGSVQVPRDPCAFAQGFTVPGPAPDDERPADPANLPLEGVEPGRWYSVREAIGTSAFDPNAGLDQSLAEAVLLRMYPALRYAYDSATWLLRVPERWEERKDLAGWAVAQLAPLMPVGDPTAEKGSEMAMRAANRGRLMGAPGAGAVAKKIQSLVSGGTHPASVRLGALDADPEVLWAGGMAYSLRRSTDGPAFAEIPTDTPHLHSAGVTPEKRPTPLWDAFTAAVWPDPELRAWALRVLSIAVTGYSDRALPVLLGETGRGKTQIVHLMMSVLGSYAHAANPKLLGSGHNEHDTIVYALKGRRLSFIDEAPSDRKAGQERLKQLTGGGELTARQMNRDPITFHPTHTLVLTANDEPVLIDPAVRARVRLIPCEGDPELVRTTRAAIGHIQGRAWREEAPGVLAAMMAEAAGWLADPTTASVGAAPDSVRYLAEHIGAEQDPVTVWVEEETEAFDDGTPGRELYQAFVASCRRNSMDRSLIPSESKWGRQVTRLGYPPVHTRTGKRRALRLRMGGWATSAPAPAPAEARDGLGPECDGFVTGSPTNPSQAFSQVNPRFPESGDGCDGLEEGSTHMRAHARTREGGPEFCAEPVTERTPSGADSPPDLQERDAQGRDGLEKPKPSQKPKRQQSPEAKARAAAKREEARLAKVAEAAGGAVALPALVTPTGVRGGLDLADVHGLLESITSTEAPLTVDVEHTGYPVGHELYALRTVQLGNDQFAVVLDADAPEQTALATRHLKAATVLHAHSATADLVPLAHAGILDAETGWAKMHDTVIPALLADPSSTGSSDTGLKDLARAVLGAAALSPEADAARSALFKAGKWLVETKVTTPIERSGWAQVDHGCATMVRYDGSDVIDDAALAKRLPWPTPELLDRERTAQRMVSRVAHTGLRVDGEQVERLRDHWGPALEDAGARLRAAGVENPGSDQQVAAVAEQLGARLPRTPTGRPSVAAGVLEPMSRAGGELGAFVRARLDYQKAETALGLFLEPYHQLVTRGDGRARPTVYTLGADTGRMSCVRPNLQQVPRVGGFRACLTADPGMLLISADFSGVELRVAAALSQDPNLLRMLSEDVDLHWESTRQVFGPEATKEHRYQVKRGNFGWLYGGKAPTLAKHMGTDEATAQRLIDTLTHLLPGVTEWSRVTKLGVESGRTQFPTYAGRVVHMPMKAPHAAPNYCIQGTARELLIDALLRWKDTRWGDCPLLPVHDELVVMVPEDEAVEATAALVECMQTELYGVPIVADASEPSFEWKDAS